MHRDHLGQEAVEQTLGVLFKHHADPEHIRSQWLEHLLRDRCPALLHWPDEALKSQGEESMPVHSPTGAGDSSTIELS